MTSDNARETQRSNQSSSSLAHAGANRQFIARPFSVARSRATSRFSITISGGWADLRGNRKAAGRIVALARRPSRHLSRHDGCMTSPSDTGKGAEAALFPADAIARVGVMLPVPIGGAPGGVYDYLRPVDLDLKPGDFVEVPLGRRSLIGVVWHDGVGDVATERLKAVTSLLASKGIEGAGAARASLLVLQRALEKQVATIAYDDAFLALILLFVLAAPCLLLVKRMVGRPLRNDAAAADLDDRDEIASNPRAMLPPS